MRLNGLLVECLGDFDDMQEDMEIESENEAVKEEEEPNAKAMEIEY